jgi:N-acetylglucosamine kinase-like BadF-type ATPase
MVGYQGMLDTLQAGLASALQSARLDRDAIAGAGFGIAGYDWPSDKPFMIETIDQLGLSTSYQMVNDALLGVFAGAREGWGIGLVSGTGCNCWGIDSTHQRLGRVTGMGLWMGEAAGGSELIQYAMQRVNHAWIKRGPETSLARAFIDSVGARSIEDLLEGYTQGHYSVGAELAPLVFRAAESGDLVARQVVHWAGCELGEMANAVARQLDFLELDFDVVLAGSMFSGGGLLVEPLRETILKVCPKARFLRLTVPPVVGAVLIGMEHSGLKPDARLRSRLIESTRLR